MDYLLVGNGPASDLANVTKQADAIAQINDCPHAEELPVNRTRYIFLSNPGQDTKQLVDKLISRRVLFPHAKIILVRNPAFYTVKKSLLKSFGRAAWHNYRLSEDWKRLREYWPIEIVSCFSALRLERKLRALGMPRSCMPSTGMITYDWLSRQLFRSDSLEIQGFSFEGWDRHPWHVERQLVRSKEAYFPWQAE
jgi:hypothetical protein